MNRKQARRAAIRTPTLPQGREARKHYLERNGITIEFLQDEVYKARERGQVEASLTKTRREDMMRAIMESMRKEPVHFERKIIIHGAMIYGCQDCGTRWVMYLEKGLEEKNFPDRKPVPFGIRCPFCGGFHGYDISGYIPLPDTDYAELPDGESCFVNLPDRDCGTPRYGLGSH